jgi:chemotaxis protein histidine kinase CheA
MSYLDLSEPQSFTYVNLLLQNLLAKGAILCIFNHHVEEIADNLRAALRQAALGNGHRATFRRLRQANFRAYVESVLANLETTIRRKQITVIKTPNTPETYFSQAQQGDLLSRLGNYAVHARDRDASAIAGIIRLRQGNIAKTSDFHQAQHIFVTDNAHIAKRAAIFLREERIYQEWDVPAAITDRHLAGLVLVLFGAQAANDIARQKLIANCASALEPSEELLTSVTNFLSGLDDNRAEHFRAIMTTQRSAQYMTRFMLEQKLTLDKVEDAEKVLAHLEEQWKTTLRAESQEDADRVKKEYEEVLRLEREATARAANEAEKINLQLEEHKLEASNQNEANQIELSRLRESLFAIEQSRIEAENQEKQQAKAAVERLFDEAEGNNHKRLALSVKVLLAISLPITGVVTYWALAPDSLLIKALIIAGALTVTFISSALAGKKIEDWSKSKARKEFHSKIRSEYIIQRYIDHLAINYNEREVVIRVEAIASDTPIFAGE